MQAARLATRLQREIAMLTTDPPPGVCAWPCGDLLTHLEAQIQGPAGTVYSSGLFKLDVRVPERYPFEPPNVRFVTPIYHPNIDTGGRICLDILVMPPKGAWRPSLNIPTVLASIGLLLSEPNPDDGLMSDITAEYKHNRSSFDRKARELTEKHALPSSCTENSADQKFPSVVVDCPAEGPSVRDFCERNSKRTLLSLGGKVLEADPQTISESSRVKVEAGSTPHPQRLGLARKLSLSQKPHQLVTDCGAKVPGINGTLEEKQTIEDKKTAEKQSGDDKGSTGAGQPTQHRLGTVLEETLEEQGLKQRASNPQDGNNAAPSVPVKSGREEEPGRPSRLSLLSRLKLSRSIGSQQKPPASNVQQPTASVKRNLDCIVVSDSESEDDHVPVPRSRLTLTQRLRRYDNISPQGL